MKHSVIDDIPFVLLDWSDLTHITDDLAQQIQARAAEYDRLIAVANGGLTMVRYLGDRLNLKVISLLQISSYQGVAEHDPEPIIQQPLSSDVQGERLLIFEDIVDSGATLEVLKKYLETIGVDHYEIATQVEKSHASEHADYVGLHQDGWIIFPYEVRETIVDLKEKWQTAGVSESEIRERFMTIGFLPRDIDSYLD